MTHTSPSWVGICEVQRHLRSDARSSSYIHVNTCCRHCCGGSSAELRRVEDIKPKTAGSSVCRSADVREVEAGQWKPLENLTCGDDADAKDGDGQEGFLPLRTPRTRLRTNEFRIQFGSPSAAWVQRCSQGCSRTCKGAHTARTGVAHTSDRACCDMKVPAAARRRFSHETCAAR